MIRWFGPSWGAPVTRQTPHIETPVGSECPQCKGIIDPGDRGVVTTLLGGPADPAELAWHLVCFLINIGVGPSSLISHNEHAIALAEVGRLIALDLAIGSPESAQLLELVTVVETYEKKHFPI